MNIEIKKAKVALNKKTEQITFEQIEHELRERKQTIIYLDKENNAKDIKKVIEHFNKAGCSVHCHEIYYGLDAEDYIYEMHIIAPITA